MAAFGAYRQLSGKSYLDLEALRKRLKAPQGGSQSSASPQKSDGPLRVMAAGSDDEPQKKKRRATLGAPTNIGKKRLLGG